MDHKQEGTVKTTIRQAVKQDAAAAAGMAVLMWGSHTVEGLAKEFEQLISSDSGVIFLLSAEGQPAGFAQCQLRRDYVEGTSSSPVGYLEGIYVIPGYRNLGYAAQLLAACEAWARAKGCTEFASDCELDNSTSLKFHLKAGFAEANRIICFTKRL